MQILVWLIGLGIRFCGFPIRLLLGTARATGRRLRWIAQIGLVVVRSNSIARAAIILSVINFGLLMWQIWPEDTEQTITSLSEPTRNSETHVVDNTPGRIAELENEIRDLSREQQFQFNRLIDCINYPTPFGCQRNIP